MVDLRTVSFDVPPQEILSKDSVTVAVDAVVYYRIQVRKIHLFPEQTVKSRFEFKSAQNPLAAVCNVSDAGRSTQLLASTTLRNVLGTKNLSEILSDRYFKEAQLTKWQM